ncbi:uroporphyrinogen-III C-methyltransferase [Ammoniphilus sp. CFH 90114]|uniref:uroporphyrinogen-III C-methyltransferase n=1 Tax=Ammoniphilus sp. CFH 90114 TaxID=2493665 RepID=UPI00100F0545|nr:uroporphyrinogen-III C-methyltransferase [Ammoniphilus sp. CFH 90114]RXT05806.1 uroporphyrinogen-III C-methyltransferase [Ammoniphilus sp. CFH 90114]
MRGKVYLVGAGPGDPKLITIKGMECIREADVIVYDRLANPVLLDYRKDGAELIYCGKLPHHHTLRQEAINQLLVEKALEGKVVTRLKGGDPCVFGRVGEEAEVLVFNHIEFEIIPGVTSGIAVPAYAGIPVTHRDYGSTFAMVTGQMGRDKEHSEEKWESLARGMDTIAFYMGVANLPHICSQLMKYGRRPETPVAVISWGTTPQQTTVIGTLCTIEEIVELTEVTNPAIILVGEVVRLREKIKWFQENKESLSI